MWNHSLRTTLVNFTYPPLIRGPKRIHPQESPVPSLQNPYTNSRFWQCTGCGRRYEDPSVTTIFISPPPITTCIMSKTNETQTHSNGNLADTSVPSDATCDYVRVHQTPHETDIGEQLAERETLDPAVETPIVDEYLARACDRASMNAIGEHGRVSRQNGAVHPAYMQAEDDDDDECDFWKAECMDVDCIHEGYHCRYQCAMAEMDEKPTSKVHALRQGFTFPWSSTLRTPKPGHSV